MCLERIEAEQTYSSTLSLTSVLCERDWLTHTPAALPPEETHYAL